MKIALVVALLVVAVGAAYFLRGKTLAIDRGGGNPRVMTPGFITARNIPSIVEQLAQNKTERSFAAFVFGPADDPGSERKIVNLQFSVEGGVVGLDWVLLAPGNKTDKEKVEAFMKAQGHVVVAKEGNGVHYLRVEGDRIAELAVQIVKDIYHLQDHDQMALFTDRFEWKP